MRRPARTVGIGALVVSLAALGAAAVFVALPLPKGLLDLRRIASVRIEDRDGGLLRELLSTQDGRSIPLAQDALPPNLASAFIAAEDKDFFHHFGVSPTAMGRAFWQDLKARRVVAGGSTLTQQLARNLVPRPRTLLGKLQEALWAMRLEAHLSKRQILTEYLNRISFGNGTFGVEAASRLYFARPASALSLAQMAALAAIPRGPAVYDPYRHFARLDARRRWVLERMGALKRVPLADARHAEQEPLDLTAFRSAFRAPHAVELIAANLTAWGLGEATRIETTLDPALQDDAERIVSDEVGRLSQRRVTSAAALAVDNATGEVLAYVGSADYFNERIEGQNDGVRMRRQPGSALKPFAYAEAFREGLTPATTLPDLRATFEAARGGYSPKNYDGLEHGPVRIREALANSYNIPAVRVAEQLGPDRLLRALRSAGFEGLTGSAQRYGLGLVLGDGEVSLWELARAYRGLSLDGVVGPLTLIRHAYRADGSEIRLRPELTRHRFAQASAVKLVTDILSDNAARSRAFGLDSVLRLPFAVAAKTGTSKGYSDNWTAGFTHERTVAVWAGNFDGSPMVEVSGITGAGPIFHALMRKAMAGVHPLPLYDPAGLEHARICPLSGELAGPDCPTAMDEVFAKGTAPKETCGMHKHLAQGLPAGLAARCAQLLGQDGRLVDFGPRYAEWAQRTGAARDPWLVPACAGEVDAKVAAGSQRILSPSSGDEFRLNPDLPPEVQTIPLKVVATPAEGPLAVRVDGEEVLQLGAPFAARLPATAGRHTLSVVDREGSSLGEVRFRVRAR